MSQSASYQCHVLMCSIALWVWWANEATSGSQSVDGQWSSWSEVMPVSGAWTLTYGITVVMWHILHTHFLAQLNHKHLFRCFRLLLPSYGTHTFCFRKGSLNGISNHKYSLSMNILIVLQYYFDKHCVSCNFYQNLSEIVYV